jgi:hypothetical protein
MHAPLPSGSASDVKIRGVIREIDGSEFPTRIKINDEMPVRIAEGGWQSSGAFVQQSASEPEVRTLIIAYAGESPKSFSSLRGKYVVSIDFLSPPDAYTSTEGAQTVALLSPSSVPETVYTPTPDPALPTQFVLPIFAAPVADRQTVFGVAAESAVVPTAAISPAAAAVVTVSPLISRAPNVQIQSAQLAAVVSMRPAVSVASAQFAVRRCSQ